MKKIITNPEKLKTPLKNYVATKRVWVDEKQRWYRYTYVDTPLGASQNFSEKAVYNYNGSGNKKNVPNPKMHKDEINSSKDIEITIEDVNYDFPVYEEIKIIFLGNWPNSRKPDPKTKTYNFGEDSYNQHARGATHLGGMPYADMAREIQLDKLKEKVEKHEKNLKNPLFKSVKKYEKWHRDIYYNRDSFFYLCNIQGRNLISSITENVGGLKEEMNENPDPEHWRYNDVDGSSPYYLQSNEKDSRERPAGGNTRGTAFPISAMREKGMYWYEIPYEDFDLLTETDLEDFSAWLNKRKTYRVEPTNEETLKEKIINKIVDKPYLLTPKTIDAGGLPRFEPIHPVFLSALKGYEKTFTDSHIKRILSSITRKFESKRVDEVRKEEGSIDCSDDGMKIPSNREYWNIKTNNAIQNKKPVNTTHKIKSAYGIAPKTITEYLVTLQADINKIKKLEKNNDEESIKEIKKIKDKDAYNDLQKLEMPHDLDVFLWFKTHHKYKRYISGGSRSGDKYRVAAIEKICGKMIEGCLRLIPIDPKLTKEEKENDNLDSRPSSFREEYGDQTHIEQNEAGVQQTV